MIFRKLAQDSVIYGGADLVTKVLSFFSFPIIAAVLSPKEFGVLELIFTATALLGLVINCGLNSAVQRFYWDDNSSVKPNSKPIIVTSGLMAQIFFSGITIVAGFFVISLLVPLIDSRVWPISWIALVAAILVMVLSQWSQYILDVIRLHLKPWRFLTLALISRVLVVIAGVIAVLGFDLGIDGLLAAQASVLLLILPLALWMIRCDFQPTYFSWEWCIKLIRFGYPFIFAGIAYWLLSSMDRWMLASIATVEEVGIYSVAFRFASVVMFVSIAFGQAWSPVAMKVRIDNPENYRSIYGDVLLILLFIMLIVGGGIALFSGEIISLVMPDEYLSSALPLAILCFGVILQSTLQVTAIGISIEKKTYLFARLSWVVAGVNFIGNWLLIPSYGAVGAAWATVISYIVLTASYLYCTQKIHPLILQWRNIAILCCLGVLVAIFSVVFVSSRFDLGLFLVKLAFAILCLFSGWRLLPLGSFKGV